MREINKISEALFEKIRDRFEDVSLGDENAKATQDPEKARFFNFDYVVDDYNYGNITISVIDEISLKVYFSKNISDNLDGEQQKEWYGFLRELREFARRNLLSFEPRDITRSTLKHRDLYQVSKADSTYSKDEVIGEGRMYGTSRSSYENEGPVRIIVRHSGHVDPEKRGDRSRHIRAIYLENSEGERLKLPHNSLRYARAMARHVSESGQINDDFGQYITRIAEECNKLKSFKYAVSHRTFEDTNTQQMVEAAFEYHALLNNTLKRMGGRKGYNACKENFHTDEQNLMDGFDIEEMRERFVKRIYKDNMDEALPIVQKAYKMKKENKFAQQFENWASTVAEGTWAVPNTDDDVAKLIDILSNPLPVGVDAQNATNALYNILGDDKLFDKFQEIAKINPEQDVGNLVADWLQDHLPHIYQQIENEIGDPDYPAEPNEVETDESAYADSMPGSTQNMLATTNEGEWQEDDVEMIQSAIIRRILNSISEHSELLKKAGPEGVMNAARDVASFHAPVEELGTSDISNMVRQVYNEVGVEYPEVTEERDIEDSEQVCVYCGEPRDDKLGCCDENHFITKKEFDNEVNEAKDTIKYDPKTGKLTGWEHEGDWKKQTTKKDPVGKIHHMSDVARRRTEKLAQGDTLEEAFEKALNEAAINVGDKVKCPNGKEGTITGDADGYYHVKCDDGETYSYRMQEVKPIEEEITMPDNPDYSEYDKPTFLRKNPKELPKKSGWTGYNTDEPAHKRKADYEQEREQLKRLAGVK